MSKSAITRYQNYKGRNKDCENNMMGRQIPPIPVYLTTSAARGILLSECVFCRLKHKSEHGRTDLLKKYGLKQIWHDSGDVATRTDSLFSNVPVIRGKDG